MLSQVHVFHLTQCWHARSWTRNFRPLRKTVTANLSRLLSLAKRINIETFSSAIGTSSFSLTNSTDAISAAEPGMLVGVGLLFGALT